MLILTYLTFWGFFKDDIDEECVARQWLDKYEMEHMKLDEELGQKDWEYYTNINDETSAASVRMKA